MIVDAEERKEAFDLLIRSDPWQLFLKDIVREEARRARGVLLTSKNFEEIREAQEALRILKKIVEYPYKQGPDDNRVPPGLSVLWDA